MSYNKYNDACDKVRKASNYSPINLLSKHCDRSSQRLVPKLQQNIEYLASSPPSRQKLDLLSYSHVNRQSVHEKNDSLLSMAEEIIEVDQRVNNAIRKCILLHPMDNNSYPRSMKDVRVVNRREEPTSENSESHVTLKKRLSCANPTKHRLVDKVDIFNKFDQNDVEDMDNEIAPTSVLYF